MPHSVSTVLEVDGERVRVIRRRNQRRAYIRVKAPDGCVEVSAPWHVADARNQKTCFQRMLNWIKRQRFHVVEGEKSRLGAPTPEEIAERCCGGGVCACACGTLGARYGCEAGKALRIATW